MKTAATMMNEVSDHGFNLPGGPVVQPRLFLPYLYQVDNDPVQHHRDNHDDQDGSDLRNDLLCYPSNSWAPNAISIGNP
jgi:hypothetical protein